MIWTQLSLPKPSFYGLTSPLPWVRYTDYIKNVASSEIYSTWPESTIYANVLAIMSFTLNRVYTEWCRNQGYTAIPKVTADGIYGSATAAAVRSFQNIFGLPATGITDFPTWYAISRIYVGVTRIADRRREKIFFPNLLCGCTKKGGCLHSSLSFS